MQARIETLDFHGLPALALTSASGARAVVSLFGAQVLSWLPPDGEERLYLSDRAHFDGERPIRGGIPVCFPQFAALGKLPRHGLVRTARWTLREQRSGEDYALVTLGTSEDERTWAAWPQLFDAELTVAVEGTRLDVELGVENTGHAPFAFTAALHTYLRVREVENARLEGLHGHEYRDVADGGRIRRETGEAVIVEGELDRIYHDVRRPLVLTDGDRHLAIQAEGFNDVVVWNPFEARCAALQDMPASGFRRMLCVEAATAQRKIELAAGESWSGRQTLLAR